jgi:hypothetical protein
MTSKNGILIGCTKEDHIQLTAQRDGKEVTFVLSPEDADKVAAKVQSEISKARGEIS